jgi:phosphoglycerate dehydrogenase-like enzyme
MSRLTIALAMYPGLERATFRRAQREQIERLVDVADWTPMGTWDDPRADDLLARADVLVTHWGCPRIDATVLDRAPRLAMVAHAGGTVKGGDLAVMTREVLERSVLVTSCAAANAVPVAEYALAAILWAGKDAFGARARLRGEVMPDGRPDRSFTVGNWGKRIGIVGASLVGRALIELLRPFRLDVSVYDPFLSEVEAAGLGVEKVDDLVALARASDVLSLHAPDVAATQGMISAEVLAALPDGATFVNTARPALVDQDALLAECASGRLDAVLDVTDPEPLPAGHPLLALANVVVTPHVAGSAGTELARLGACALDELERFVQGRPPAHPVTLEAWDRTA